MSMIILASGSPRRKELLETIGLTFEIIPAQGEEVITASDPADVVMELSSQKATEVASGIYAANPVTDTMIIGADTVVSIDGKILGKPVDEEDAFEMLSKLSGRSHKVYTGVTIVLIDPDGKTGKLTFFEETSVSVAKLSEHEIRRYIATGEPMDKAGAYGIQGAFSSYVTGIEGDYQNVVGFPVSKFYAELKKVGIDILEW